MLIVNPTFGRTTRGSEKLAGAAVDWRSDPIALFSNSKPNAKELLEGIREKLAAIRDVANVEHVYKPSASQPAANDLIARVAGAYRAAVLAIAD